MSKEFLIASACLLASGCATLSPSTERVIVGSAAGALAGSIGGATLSPNADDRGLNALVFGLSGALTGGAIAILTDKSKPSAQTDLKSKELAGVGPSRQFSIETTQTLPEFVKSRVQPAIIEEYLEDDRVTDEGTLHEPHRAYRIKRPTELFSRPSEPKSKADK